MRYFKAKVKVIFPQKPFFTEKHNEETIYVSVPSEWDKAKIDRFIIAASEADLKHWPVSKKLKRQANFIVQNKCEVLFFPKFSRYFEWDFDDKRGEWEVQD